MIILIGERAAVFYHFRVHHIADKDRVGPQINLVEDFGFDDGKGMVGY